MSFLGMGNDPRGVHQSLVSNVLWNTHSPKLTKVRGFRGFQLRKEGTCRRGYCNNRCDSDSLVFYNNTTRVSPHCCHAFILSQHIVNVAVGFIFTTVTTLDSYWKLRVYFIWHCRGDQPRQRFVMPLAMQHWVSQLLSLAASNSQQPVLFSF